MVNLYDDMIVLCVYSICVYDHIINALIMQLYIYMFDSVS